MARPRATGQHLILSGQADRKPMKYSKYNLTEGILPAEGTEIIAPKGLSKLAKKGWETTVPALLQMRSLSVTDFVNLEQLFLTYDEVITIRKQLKEYDKNHSTDDDYIPKRKALSTMLNNTLQTFISLSSRYGMTPADRTRLPQSEPTVEETDPLEILTNG